MLQYSTAMKIRACITGYYDGTSDCVISGYSFDREHDQWVGNPSRARVVMQYMRSLKKRKARTGERTKRMCAVTVEIMQALYRRRMRKDTAVCIRQYCIYLFAFLALLRSDEVLNLQVNNIQFSERYITLTLDHRKDAQGGEVAPFVLHRNDDEQHLCPVRAFMDWLFVRGEEPGPIFIADKRESLVAGSTFSYGAFAYRFHEELQAIGIRNWHQYGTHSFRRGGSQFYLAIRRKTIHDICAWGGWTDVSVALRYLIGANDNLEIFRHEFTRPPKTGICNNCRRNLNG